MLAGPASPGTMESDCGIVPFAVMQLLLLTQKWPQVFHDRHSSKLSPLPPFFPLL